jgi:hypothetical protein
MLIQSFVLSFVLMCCVWYTVTPSKWCCGSAVLYNRERFERSLNLAVDWTYFQFIVRGCMKTNTSQLPDCCGWQNTDRCGIAGCREIVRRWAGNETQQHYMVLVCVGSLIGIQHAMRVHKRHNFRGKKVIEHKMCVLIFSATFVWNISRCKKNCARYDQKFKLVFLYSVRYSCQILMKLEYSWQIFEKYSNIKLHENPPSGSRIVSCGRTDGQTGRQTWRSWCSLFAILWTRQIKWGAIIM